ncbi:Adenine nucleotide alpha hydrolases-like protein [Zostera marina]|uniref:Adenine nucleotide alpha hydrolases-like protein n=1 Tax=Zostera marina TaxID=29655 RepID=A0A0K9PVS8_ZOSMR|nr:Adenine nucleotide alpha hydrolases-like protein [Zostera marina]
MEGQKRVVVVVEESEAANAALGWAVGNFIRPGDIVILLHIHPSSRSRRKMQALRLKGFQLALSFKDRCSAVPEVKVEIVVKEGEQVAVISGLVEEIRASALVIGLHEQSCLYRMTPRNLGSKGLGRCRILAVKHRQEIESTTRTCIGFETVEFSQVEITRICIRPPKIRYQIFPSCAWRKNRRRRGKERG